MTEWALIALAILVVVAEVALRAIGLLSFPLFIRSETIGYYPAPNQEGAFLRVKNWAFNEESLGVARPFDVTADGVLLLGDSIVYGGNSFDQHSKLGPSLERAAHRPIWPLAAGGWAFINEIEMLRANPSLLRLPTLVLVSNSGDFGAKARWSDETAFPTRKPLSAIEFAIRKRFFPSGDVITAPVSPEATNEWIEAVDWLLRHYKGRVLWVLYPSRAQVAGSIPEFGPLLERISGRAEIIDISQAREWNQSLYLDGIHPNDEGRRVLASLIARRLDRRSDFP